MRSGSGGVHGDIRAESARAQARHYEDAHEVRVDNKPNGKD